MAYAQNDVDNSQVHNTLQLEDVFSLEYASGLAITAEGDEVYFVRNYMDIQTDKKLGNIWKVDKNKRLTPVTNGLHVDFSPSLSPDNSKLAYISTASGSAQIHMKWLETGESSQMSHFSQSPSNLSWSPDSKYIAFNRFVNSKPKSVVSLPGKPQNAQWAKPAVYIDDMYYRFDGAGFSQAGNSQIFVMSSNGGAARQVTHEKFDHRSNISWTKDGKQLIYSSNKRAEKDLEWTDTNIYAVNINDQQVTQLTDRVGPDNSPIVSPNGKMIAYLGYDQNFKNYENTELFIMDINGSNKRSITADLDRSINSIKWADNSKAIYMSYHDKGETYVAYQSLKGKREIAAKNLGGLSFGRPYTGSQFDVAEDGTIAFTYSDPQRPADIAITRKGRTNQLTDLNNDALSYKTLASIKELNVKSSFDDRDIQAWVAYPPGYEADKKAGKTFPLILEIHGGPVTNYGPHFSAEVQLMAASGYVVVYANPRGSDSYGKEFAQTIYNNYPSQDYDDLMSVVDGVIAKEAINEEALFVTGGSGGGVLTAWIVGHTDRFAAAVVAKPVINWYSFVLTTDIYPFVIKNWFEKMPWEDSEHYMKLSPISYVGNVTTPTMLLTGEADQRTPIAETEQFYQALKLRNIDTAMVRIPDAPHGIYKRPSNLMSKVAHILWWFEQYQPEKTN
ncbi:S9 family peptidase [Shewanella sp. 1_MG-2023]|uniref:S9 family peptidase n=1 Tax=unclassified Shewanella TaxID=196818 RepID=UPI0026E12E69|nr:MULTISPECIES: S9 family peptidase [unclassified Shewanella]MDO6613438.1 S9 family peptidase [Shewanella sp. 7_MG-2023]MDO6770104.1 S9 family peptidase [Shewanella sp. 2_MG-2023]MDO6794784.1 S9 family peptidase [Shewanella sp. 1_MG-2023]